MKWVVLPPDDGEGEVRLTMGDVVVLLSEESATLAIVRGQSEPNRIELNLVEGSFPLEDVRCWLSRQESR